MGVVCSTNGDVRNACKILVRREKRRRWEDNIEMDLKEISFEVVDWICLTVIGFCEYDDKPSGSRKGGEFLGKLSS
jgi:hypothetical protein